MTRPAWYALGASALVLAALLTTYVLLIVVD